MGNREALLDGAKRCLREKGFSRTTARDIAAASGVSLAAIGYHFGSKEALLSQALIEATGQWVDELARTLAESLAPDAAPMQRFEAVWARLLKLSAKDRPLWAANFEVSPQIEQMPQVRQAFAEAQVRARLGLAKLFQGLEPDDPRSPSVGAFYYALLTGVMAQWLVDPDRAPSAVDLAEALRTIASDL